MKLLTVLLIKLTSGVETIHKRLEKLSKKAFNKYILGGYNGTY